MPHKGAHNLIVEDRVWGGLVLKAHNQNLRVADYLEPFLELILQLEKAGVDPRAVLERALKKKDVT